jgi:hypothetical protein
MYQRVLLIALVACLVTPVAAQTPAGLKMRVDRSQNAQDPDDNPELKVAAMGKGFRVTGGPAGVFWNPSQTATGNYAVKATFNLQKPSNHENFYGIIFGGSALEGPMQSYTYFTVSQMGKFLLKQRNGEMTPTLVAATQHAAVNRPDAGGQSSNTLEVRVMGDSVSYVVNNQVVHTMPKGTLKTDGIAGVRVNHVLDVQIEGFEIRK